jgi:hypothetical protein
VGQGYTPQVTIQSVGQVNIGGQQINMAKLEDTNRSGSK